MSRQKSRGDLCTTHSVEEYHRYGLPPDLDGVSRASFHVSNARSSTGFKTLQSDLSRLDAVAVSHMESTPHK
ncbi:hypothetical protein T265_02111 [Opisthorchis viverrini]|uniref:Uncharacterized protein n=1 Tax=Opisthorchis viverrini TaxID=6198 RepID=A0A074ZWC2_OPIVI|nr:hypothetical protein T265_02111 [Opisthorchis viverrini]KER31748.1 hypothetical protein T265_02111 [Opisthorchis viverrini]